MRPYIFFYKSELHETFVDFDWWCDKVGGNERERKNEKGAVTNAWRRRDYSPVFQSLKRKESARVYILRFG